MYHRKYKELVEIDGLIYEATVSMEPPEEPGEGPYIVAWDVKLISEGAEENIGDVLMAIESKLNKEYDTYLTD